MLGSLILYLEGTRIMMFQLSGFYYKGLRSQSQTLYQEQNLGFAFSGVKGLRSQSQTLYEEQNLGFAYSGVKGLRVEALGI